MIARPMWPNPIARSEPRILAVVYWREVTTGNIRGGNEGADPTGASRLDRVEVCRKIR
jgi:hypothetical protein